MSPLPPPPPPEPEPDIGESYGECDIPPALGPPDLSIGGGGGVRLEPVLSPGLGASEILGFRSGLRYD